jgi:hypothetical protein
MKEFLNCIKEFLKWRVAGNELDELLRYKMLIDDYRRWLCEFPEVRIVINNLYKELNEPYAMRGYSPDKSFDDVTYTVDALRDGLRRMRRKKEETFSFPKLGNAQARKIDIDQGPQTSQADEEVAVTTRIRGESITIRKLREEDTDKLREELSIPPYMLADWDLSLKDTTNSGRVEDEQ